MSKKECRKCGEFKDREFFHKRKSTKDGLRSPCKACISEKSAKYYKKNKDAVADYQRKYYSENKEYVAERSRKYYSENKEALDDYQRNYSADNKNSVADRNRNYQKHRRAEDPKFAMINRISARMRQALAFKGLTKTTKTMEALGCTSDQFQRHIELQFSKGMSWANRGKWHLDHIVPISSAETEQEIVRLSHYLNLRPLWAEENLSKSKKQTHLI